MAVGRWAMRRYLANLNAIDAKLCIGMGLLGLEDLLDGDRAERVSAAALSLSERLPKGARGEPWTHCLDCQIRRLHRLRRHPSLHRRRRHVTDCRSLLRLLARSSRTRLSSTGCSFRLRTDSSLKLAASLQSHTLVTRVSPWFAFECKCQKCHIIY